jgi:hypothetical protein
MPGDSGLTDTHAFRYHRIHLPTVLQCPTLQAEDSPRTRTRSCFLRDCRYALIRSQGHSKRLRPGVLDAGIPYVHAIALSVFTKLRRRSAVCGYLGSEFDKGDACRLVVAFRVTKRYIPGPSNSFLRFARFTERRLASPCCHLVSPSHTDRVVGLNVRTWDLGDFLKRDSDRWSMDGVQGEAGYIGVSLGVIDSGRAGRYRLELFFKRRHVWRKWQ